MSPADKRLLTELAGRPMFRCSGGWRRGPTKISARKASELLAQGAFRRTVSKSGTPMIIPCSPADPRALVAHAPVGSTEQRRPWWIDP